MKLLSHREKLHGFQTFVLIILLLFFWYRSRDKVRAESIELTSNGKTVAVLKTNNDGEAELQLIGKDGKSLSITPDGIAGWNESGKISLSLRTGSHPGNKTYGPGLTLHDTAGENRAAMYLSDGSPFLTFSSYHNMISGGRRYATNLLMHSTTQTASIQLYDKDGNLAWQAHENDK